MLEISWNSTITKDPIRLADAIELAVAFGDDNHGSYFTRADFQHFLSTESLDDDDLSYLSGDDADERNEEFEQALTLVRNRARWLGPAYPFSVDGDEVRFTPQATLSLHLPYLFLLVCSNKNTVPALGPALPNQFEELCKEALRALFPDWAEVVSFSQKSRDRRETFGYAAKDAVPKLARKLNATLVNAEQLPCTQQEFGVDVIAICSFGDQSSYPFFAFAQCTTEQEWWKKRHEADANASLAGFVHLNAPHTNFLMIPYLPRYSLARWDADPGKTGNCILCDRFRICVLLEKADFFRQDDLSEGIAGVFGILEENLDSMHFP